MTPWNMTTLSRDEGGMVQLEIWREKEKQMTKVPQSPHGTCDGLWKTQKKKLDRKETERKLL